MTALHDLALALDRVPTVLLDADEVKVLGDALHSLEALEAESENTPSVVLVGPSGSGRSWLANGLAGSTFSDTGHLRPTTRDTVEVVAPIVGTPVRLQDTPAWEHAGEAVGVVMEAADLVVVVVSQTRYADASVAGLLEVARASAPTIVVMNGVGEPVDPAVRSDAERVVGSDVVPVGGSGDIDILKGIILDGLEPVDDARHAVIRAAAIGAARFVVATVTGRSTALGHLLDVAAHVDPRPGPLSLSVIDDWPTTARGVAATVAGLRDGVDHEIGLQADRGLFERVLATLEPWDADAFSSRLEEWKLDTDAAFIAAARIRWRRRSARALLTDTAWKMAVNPTAPVHPRVARLLGNRVSEVRGARYEALEDLIDADAAARRDAWIGVGTEAADYTPGSLLAAIERFEAVA